MSDVRLLAERNGPLRIYRYPEEGRQYAMGVDPSEGARDGDPSAICVVDQETLEQCCVWTASLDPRTVGRKAYWVGCFYNNAFCVVEVNKDSSVVQEMMDLGYTNLYRRIDLDSNERVMTKKLGFRTDTSTRGPLFSRGRIKLIEGHCRIHSKPQIREMSRIHYDYAIPDRPVHPKGEHDDETIAWLLAVFGRDMAYVAGVVTPEPEKPKSSEDRHFDEADAEVDLVDRE